MADNYGFSGRTGIDVLAGILKHCDSKTTGNVLKGLEKDLPQVVVSLRQRILTFDDLAYADARGIQRLLKVISLRDLATSLKNAPEGILRNVAENLSPRALCDLKEEIQYIKSATPTETERARERIMFHVAKLISDKEMFINRSANDLVY